MNPPSEQLNSSQQLNQGGSHLGTAELNGGDGKIGGILGFIGTNHDYKKGLLLILE